MYLKPGDTVGLWLQTGSISPTLASTFTIALLNNTQPMGPQMAWNWLGGQNAAAAGNAAECEISGSGSYICGPNQAPVWGTQGVETASNSPGYRALVSGAWDNNNSASGHYFWLFSGEVSGEYEYPADLWRWNPTNNLWTWMAGAANGFCQQSVVGPRYSGSSSYYPGGRAYHRLAPGSGTTIWVFGGVGSGQGCNSCGCQVLCNGNLSCLCVS